MSVGRARGTRVPAGFCSSGGRPLCECLTPVRFPAGDPELIPCEGPAATRTFVPLARVRRVHEDDRPVVHPTAHGRANFPSSARHVQEAPDAVDWRRTSIRGSPRTTSRSHPPMRSKRLLAASLTVLAVAACTSSTPGWTYAPAPSATPCRRPTRARRPRRPRLGRARPRPRRSPRPRPAQPRRPEREPRTQCVRHGHGRPCPPRTSPSIRPSSAPPRTRPSRSRSLTTRRSPTTSRSRTRPAPASSQGEVFTGVATRTYDVPALAAGSYQFVCTVHPNMVGTLTAQ